jgi:hypothetical protein
MIASGTGRSYRVSAALVGAHDRGQQIKASLIYPNQRATFPLGFFDRRPLLSPPDYNCLLIALARTLDRLLLTPAQCTQQATHMVGVVCDVERAFDHGCHARIQIASRKPRLWHP